MGTAFLLPHQGGKSSRDALREECTGQDNRVNTARKVFEPLRILLIYIYIEGRNIFRTTDIKKYSKTLRVQHMMMTNINKSTNTLARKYT